MASKPYTVNTIPITKTWKIIITKQTQPWKETPYLCFPGWRVDKGEDYLIAAKREMQEETWLWSDSVSLYKSLDMAYKVDYQFLIYIAKDCEFKFEQNLDGGETVEVLEIDFDEMVDIICSDAFGLPQFAVDVFRMKEQWKIWEFKKLLGL